MERLHSLLRRQLKRRLGDAVPVSAAMESFIRAVNEAYHEFDADRSMLERSLELSSQELLQANSEMRAVFQAIPDLFFRLDSDGRILDCKAGTPSDLYLGATDLVGKRIHDIPLKEVAVTFEEALDKVRRDRSMVSSEYFLEIDGKRQSYEARLLPLLVDQVIVFIRNITERKQREEELLRISKLDSVGVLAGGIAHDFNNILTAIIGNLSLAKESAKRSDPMYEILGETERAAIRAKKLVRQLLTFSRGGVPVRKVTGIGDLLRESAGFSLSGSNVSCEFSIPDGLWPVNVDEGQISQVIDNLVINGKQAMPGGGTIWIHAENITVEDGDLRHGIPLHSGRYVKVVVEDHGLGIPKEHIDKIFDPYFTTKQTGSGLGLATAYAIVKRHDGYIAVRSEAGVGTAFSLYLPASSEWPTEHKGDVTLRRGAGRVLVMDDEELIRNVSGRMLEHLGYSVGFARNGEEALDAYREAKGSGRPFDVVIMDVTVPAGMGGEEAIRHLREIDPDIRAIVTSGYSEEPVMAEFRKYGFNGVVTKPFEIHELAEALRDVLKGARSPDS